MALSMHLYGVTTQVTNAPHALPFAIAVVLLGAVRSSTTAIVVRVISRSRKMVTPAGDWRATKSKSPIFASPLPRSHPYLHIQSNEIFGIIAPRNREDFSVALHQPHHRVHAKHKVSGTIGGRWAVERVKNVHELRRKIACRRRCPSAPLSIYETLPSPRASRDAHQRRPRRLCRKCLRQAALGDEAKDRLSRSGPTERRPATTTHHRRRYRTSRNSVPDEFSIARPGYHDAHRTC